MFPKLMISLVLINRKEAEVSLKQRTIKEYTIKDLITKTAKESDNVAHNILAYYITNKSDEAFKKEMATIAGEEWDVTDKMASAKMAGQVMESIYNQNGFVFRIPITKHHLIISGLLRIFLLR